MCAGGNALAQLLRVYQDREDQRRPQPVPEPVVHVEGRVTNSFGALGTGGYQVDDGTGRIYVISNRGVPSRGSKVAVSGRVMNGITAMGRSFGTTIEEHGHRVRGY